MPIPNASYLIYRTISLRANGSASYPPNDLWPIMCSMRKDARPLVGLLRLRLDMERDEASLLQSPESSKGAELPMGPVTRGANSGMVESHSGMILQSVVIFHGYWIGRSIPLSCQFVSTSSRNNTSSCNGLSSVTWVLMLPHPASVGKEARLEYWLTMFSQKHLDFAYPTSHKWKS